MSNTQRATIFILAIAALTVWALGLRAALRPGVRADKEAMVSSAIVDLPAEIVPAGTSRPPATPTPSSEPTSATQTATNTPTSSPTATATLTSTPSPSATATSTPSPTPSATPSPSPSPSATASSTATATLTSTPSPSATATSTPSPTPSATPSPSPSPSATPSPTATASLTSTPSPSATPSPSPSPTASATRRPSPTLAPSPTGTLAIPQVGHFLLVDQDEQIMHVYKDGIKIRDILVSTGRPVENAYTPAWRGDVGRYWGGGPFLDTNLYSDYMWYLFPGTRGSILIHSVPFTWDGDMKVYDRPDALGVEPTSHGCVRISPEDALWLLGWDPVGVPIEITPWSGEIGPPDESL